MRLVSSVKGELKRDCLFFREKKKKHQMEKRGGGVVEAATKLGIHKPL